MKEHLVNNPMKEPDVKVRRREKIACVRFRVCFGQDHEWARKSFRRRPDFFRDGWPPSPGFGSYDPAAPFRPFGDLVV